MLIEQYKDKDGNLVQIEKYYDENLEFLAGNNLTDGYELMLDPDHMNEKDLLEQLKSLGREGILELNEIENERLEYIAKTLGIEKEDIEKISEMDEEQLEKRAELLHKNTYGKYLKKVLKRR